MYNDLFTIGNFTVHGYGLMIGIGIIAAYLMTEHLAKKKGLSPDPVFSLLVFGIIGGLVGAKLLYYITVIDQIILDPSILLNIGDGFVVYGGIIAGILAGYLTCRVKKDQFLGLSGLRDAFHCPGPGIWPDRLLSGRLLLWYGD